MTAVVDAARILRHATRVAIHDLTAMYSWQSWLFGWVTRLIMQVIFYVLIGVLLEDRSAVEFLLVGNIVLMAASGVMFAVQSTQWERYSGTLPLLVAAPGRMMWVYLGRSVEWLADALGTTVIALLVVAPLFDLSLTVGQYAQIIPALFLISVATYGVSTLLGAIVLRKPDTRNIVANLAVGLMAIVSGANFPVTYLPTPIQWLSNVFPVTHGLRAIREIVAGASLSDTSSEIGLTLIVGIAWMTAAALLFERFFEAGRRDGSIAFES